MRTKQIRSIEIKLLTYLMIAGLLLSLLSVLSVDAEEIESAAQNDLPIESNENQEMGEISTDSSEIAETDAQGEMDLAKEEAGFEQKMNILQEFPFESIVGFSWKTYSEKPLSEIYTDYKDCVGAIYFGKDIPNQDPKYNMISSGFFITEEGHFLTTFRQIKDVFSATYQFIDRNITLKLQTNLSPFLIDLELLKVDMDGDLVLFKAALEQIGVDKVPYVTLDALNEYQIGQAVFGIGMKPMMAVEGGLYPGFLTEIGVTELQESGYEIKQMKSSAIIPNTSSGSIIAATQGDVIGISTVPELKSLSDRYSLFYPIDQIKNRVNFLFSTEEDNTPKIGAVFLNDLEYQSLRETFALPEGIYISKIDLNSPAYVADMRRDDIILSVNHQAMHSASEFLKFMKQFVPGDDIHITLYRPSLGRQYEKTIYLD